MPVIKIFYDEKLDPKMRAGRDSIRSGLEAMMRDVLDADPDKCQMLMLATAHATPLPIYVDLQFRANDHRSDKAIMAEAIERTAGVITAVSDTGIRIRAFDIDQTTLHALDIPGKME